MPRGAFSVLDHADTSFKWVALTELGGQAVSPLPVRDLLGVSAGEVRHLVIRS
ncbi:hypothetical protein [Deinococcus sp. PESE-13]